MVNCFCCSAAQSSGATQTIPYTFASIQYRPRQYTSPLGTFLAHDMTATAYWSTNRDYQWLFPGLCLIILPPVSKQRSNTKGPPYSHPHARKVGWEDQRWGTETRHAFLYSCSIFCTKGHKSFLLTWLLHSAYSESRPRSSFGSNPPTVCYELSVRNTNTCCQHHKYIPSHPARSAAPMSFQGSNTHTIIICPTCSDLWRGYKHLPLCTRVRGICLSVLWLHIYPTLYIHSQPTSTDGAWFTLGLWSLTAASFGLGPQHWEITAGNCIIQ